MGKKHLLFIILFLIGVLNLIFPKFRIFIQKLLKPIQLFLSTTMLYIGYILIVFPIGLLAKLLNRDRLCLKKHNKDTYWIEASESDLERQF